MKLFRWQKFTCCRWASVQQFTIISMTQHQLKTFLSFREWVDHGTLWLSVRNTHTYLLTYCCNGCTEILPEDISPPPGDYPLPSWIGSGVRVSANFQKKNPPPRGWIRVMIPPCGLIKVSTLPCGSVNVRSTGFKKILRLVGELGSWCRLVGWLRSGPCPVGRLRSGVWVSKKSSASWVN